MDMRRELQKWLNFVENGNIPQFRICFIDDSVLNTLIFHFASGSWTNFKASALPGESMRGSKLKYNTTYQPWRGQTYLWKSLLLSVSDPDLFFREAPPCLVMRGLPVCERSNLYVKDLACVREARPVCERPVLSSRRPRHSVRSLSFLLNVYILCDRPAHLMKGIACMWELIQAIRKISKIRSFCH